MMSIAPPNRQKRGSGDKRVVRKPEISYPITVVNKVQTGPSKQIFRLLIRHGRQGKCGYEIFTNNCLRRRQCWWRAGALLTASHEAHRLAPVGLPSLSLLSTFVVGGKPESRLRKYLPAVARFLGSYRVRRTACHAMFRAEGRFLRLLLSRHDWTRDRRKPAFTFSKLLFTTVCCDLCF